MAQLSKTSWKNLYGLLGTIFPDNTTAEISEGDMRTFGENLADSFLNRTDDLLDEDDMSSDSATKVPSQQSVKAYVDAIAASAGSSGTYTPTLTSVTNVASSIAYLCHYVQVGSVVTVSGKVAITPTSSATDTSLGISLPVASNFANDYQCAGVGYNRDVNRDIGCAIISDATNNRAEMVLKPATTNNRAYYFTFSYQVI